MRKFFRQGVIHVFSLLLVASFLSPSANAGIYLEGDEPPLARFVPPPPANDSPETRREIDELLQLQRERTPKEVEYARANVAIGIEQFAGVLGNEAEAKKGLPDSVRALFQATRDDEKKLLDAAKKHFDRPRPIALDPRIKPVLEPIFNMAYPSGHATWVFMTAVLLADMVPERRAAIWGRAEDFAHQRLVGGVHYRSDIDAGRIAGAVVASYFLESDRYVDAAAKAAADLRAFLKLPPLDNAPPKSVQDASSGDIGPRDVPLPASAASSLAF
ncbi:MAG TPA: phosphatase PAP2 family protein [Steroidobacteraceae bacterium]|jgi:acid phosphatase (class A)